VFTGILDTLILFTILTPFISQAVKRLKVEKAREGIVFLGFALAGYHLMNLYHEVEGKGILIVGVSSLVGACLEIDMLSLFMATTYLMLGAFVTVYAIRYMERDTRLAEYHTLVLAMITGMVGVAFSGDFFTFFIFWEIMCLASYVLVAFRKDRWASIEAAFKYLIMSSFGAMAILMSMAFLYGLYGTLNFAYLSQYMKNTAPSFWVHFSLALILVGFGIKSAIVPLHTWLPDAHPEAPSSISALLSGILIQTGLYGMCRVLYLLFSLDIFGISLIMLSILTMTIGNILALLQDDIKRLLAYSSIAQMGYMLMGVAIGTQMALMGTFSHVFNHALLKGLAFLAAGAIWHSAGTRSLTRLKGVGKSMPITTMTLAVAFFGLVGVPSTNGFISKFLYLFRSAFEVNMAWFAIIGFLNSVFSVAYYVRVLQTLVTTPAKKVGIKEAPLSMIAPMCTMTLLIIFFGIWPDPLLTFASRASEAVIDVESYVAAMIKS
jgi:proton-translocating NADH-quinone oxidoreductase chain M